MRANVRRRAGERDAGRQRGLDLDRSVARSLRGVASHVDREAAGGARGVGGGSRRDRRGERRQLLEDFVFWYFDGFVLPLLSAHFYVTESGAFRNRVLYFRHDDWETLCRPLVERLSSETFQKLSQVNMCGA